MAEDHSLINLKILSPSTDVKGDINLPQIPASTTVKDLRLRIQNEIENRPSTERMRLIYRGRVVANDTDTLIDVFGLENIRESQEQTLHLVLRELHPGSTPSPPAPRSSTVPPNPFRPAQIPPQVGPAGPAQTNPFRAMPQPQPNSQPQIPHQHPHHHHHHHHRPHHHHHPQPHNPFSPIPPLPVNVNNLIQQQIAQAMAQNNPQNTTPPNEQSRGGTPVSTDGGQSTPASTQPGISPNTTNFPSNTTRTIRQETIGPNGERVTVTWNNTSITIPAHPNQQPFLPRPFPHPPGFPMPTRSVSDPSGDGVDQILARARISLQTARQEMDNVRVLLQVPGGIGTPPAWRIDRIRHHVQNLTQGLDQVQRGLTSLVANPTMADNQDVVLLQRSANELRGHAEELNAMLDRLRDNVASEQGQSSQGTATGALPTPSTEPRASTPQATQQGINQPSTSISAPELFILSSPQGPVGVLFDQRGTYSTAPMVSTLPFQTFTQQFSSNRQMLAGIGQQIVQNTNQSYNQLATGGAAQHQQPAGGAQQPAGQPAAQNQDQNQNQNQAQGQNQNPQENDRLAVWAGHAWLVFKLLCFMYIFAGGGGWYRPIMMAIVAVVVYLAQVGIFEAQFARIRQHFEALLPLADRPGQNNQNNQAQGANGQAQAQEQQRTEPNQNLTPEQAAQRLVQQHRDQRFGWIRQSTRTAERAVALFVASLWPGIGERMVQAQEDRARAERQAEEERQRQEEERRQQEAQQAEQSEEPADVEKTGEPSSEGAPAEQGSSKGKEKVEVAERSFSS